MDALMGYVYEVVFNDSIAWYASSAELDGHTRSSEVPSHRLLSVLCVQYVYSM